MKTNAEHWLEVVCDRVESGAATFDEAALEMKETGQMRTAADRRFVLGALNAARERCVGR